MKAFFTLFSVLLSVSFVVAQQPVLALYGNSGSATYDYGACVVHTLPGKTDSLANVLARLNDMSCTQYSSETCSGNSFGTFEATKGQVTGVAGASSLICFSK